jgi:hypothetical protein
MISAALLCACAGAPPTRSSDYGDLLQLFEDWRRFEQPPLRLGAPDYTDVRMARAHEHWQGYRDRLHALDHEGWSISEQVDWHVVRAELNGFDFNCRVLRPWQRDPAFYQQIWAYQSDTPAHEGPCNHALVELWTYEFPLANSEALRQRSRPMDCRHANDAPTGHRVAHARRTDRLRR